MYFKFRTSEEIMRETGVKKKTLLNWIHSGPKAWKIERDQDSKHFVRESIERNSKQAHTLVRIGFQLVQDSLVKRAQMGVPLDIKEALMVTNLIVSVDKMMKLAAGEPTEITELKTDFIPNKPITVKELMSAISKDPFIKIPGIKPEIEITQEVKDGEQHITNEELEGSGFEESFDSDGSNDSDGTSSEWPTDDSDF